MADTEKRKFHRKIVSIHSFVSSGDPLTFRLPTSVRTLNLSSTGALIESSDRLFEQDTCTFKIVTDDGRSGDIQGRVVWVKQEASVYRAGIVFRNISPDEQYLLDLELVRSAQSKE